MKWLLGHENVFAMGIWMALHGWCPVCWWPWVQVASAYFNLGFDLHGLGTEHWWPFGHKAAGLDLVREVFRVVMGWGCTPMSLLDVSLSQGAGAGLSWPLCATASPRCAGCPWPAGFPVWLGTWALSSCAHLVLLLGQEAVSTALLSCETRLVKAMWSCLFQSSKWRACPFRIAPRLTWDFFKANQWIWMSDSN